MHKSYTKVIPKRITVFALFILFAICSFIPSGVAKAAAPALGTHYTYYDLMEMTLSEQNKSSKLSIGQSLTTEVTDDLQVEVYYLDIKKAGILTFNISGSENLKVRYSIIGAAYDSDGIEELAGGYALDLSQGFSVTKDVTSGRYYVLIAPNDKNFFDTHTSTFTTVETLFEETHSTGIEFKEKTMRVKVGNYEEPTPTITPYSSDKIKYEISDTKIAKIKFGNVLAISPGKTTLKATLPNGKSAKCTIVVPEWTLSDKLHSERVYAYPSYIGREKKDIVAEIKLYKSPVLDLSNLKIKILQYDKNGKQLKSPVDFYTVKSLDKYDYDMDKNRYEYIYYYSFVVHPQTKKVKACAYSADYDTGGKWVNKYYNEWFKKYNGKTVK